MATKQTQAKAETPAAVKAAAKPARVHKVKAGTVEGPTGKNMPEPADAPEVTEEQRQGERRQSQNNAMAQFVASSMNTPAVHAPELTEEQLKLKAFQEAVQAMATSMGVDPAIVLTPQGTPQAKVQRAPRPEKQVQNNITRPGADTKCGRIWALADQISHDQQGAPAAIAQLRAHPSMRQENDATLKTQYARWRTYHGIKGRAAAPVVPERKSPEGRDEGIERAFNRRSSDPQPA